MNTKNILAINAESVHAICLADSLYNQGYLFMIYWRRLIGKKYYEY